MEVLKSSTKVLAELKPTLDNIKTASEYVLARTLAESKLLSKKLEAAEKEIVEALVGRKFQVEYFPDIDTKVEASASAQYDFNTDRVGTEFANQKRLPEFFKIVKIQKGKLEETLSADDALLQFALNQYHPLAPKAGIKVSNMTKAEKADFARKAP